MIIGVSKTIQDGRHEQIVLLKRLVDFIFFESKIPNK